MIGRKRNWHLLNLQEPAKLKWEDEDVDEDEVKDSWEDDDEPAPATRGNSPSAFDFRKFRFAHDPYAPADRARAIGVKLVSFDDAIATADFISLHMPLTPATSKMLNDETFVKMKKGVRIVNVTRGGLGS
ncbi:unnamed protein product [Vicia faba]|uniref:D-isomer specific 2-hydroxyacid dehydrogenase NAD-binding domain-containing protein n=1 Tax=Vicia faba TaxID=3906 RepID=A0AAV1BDI0_VICFA|nr:unnamed protein product [Vicia faba]